MKIVVLHQYYGCDTGCCGHIVEVDGKMKGQFRFNHAKGTMPDDVRVFARKLVTDDCGAEHVQDIDWEHCYVLDGMDC